MDTAMSHYFAEQKPQILNFLQRFLEERNLDFNLVNRWGPNACNLLLEFTASGKMIRGALVILAQQLFCEDPANSVTDQVLPSCFAVAAALELFQSALLIHDDIIDRDTVRRGRPSLFFQYRNRGLAEGLGAEAYHFGEAMGICLGDLAFFLGYEILASLETKPPVLPALLKLFSRELALVGLGQMEDVYLGKVHNQAREADILNVYRYKTSRYTFSLPLMAGAVLSGVTQTVLAKLEKMGENLGIIFQIKDDELGLFGAATVIGKPVGSDLKEGKMTLFMYHLLQNSDPERVAWLKSLQNAEVTESDLVKARHLVISEGIKTKVDCLVADLTKDVRRLMDSLPFQSAPHREILYALVEYNLSRNQ